eukprot:SM001750S03043  [mRNA]  locus=s1750:1313:1765:- [translate_table: standard]
MATMGTARTPAGARMRNMFACCVHPRTHTATAGANNPLTGAMAVSPPYALCLSAVLGFLQLSRLASGDIDGRCRNPFLRRSSEVILTRQFRGVTVQGAQAGAARQRRMRQRDQSAYGVKTWFGRKKRDAAVAASNVTGGPAPRRRRFGIF